jgi:hypothetical protein
VRQRRGWPSSRVRCRGRERGVVVWEGGRGDAATVVWEKGAKRRGMKRRYKCEMREVMGEGHSANNLFAMCSLSVFSETLGKKVVC